MSTEAIARADEIARLDRAGDVVGALDAAIAAHRLTPTVDLERRLIDLRHRAAAAYESEPKTPWPNEYADPFPDLDRKTIPEIHVSKLTEEIMGGAIAHHGSLIVRDFFDADQVTRTTESINRSVDAALGGGPGDSPGDDGYYEPTLGLDAGTGKLRDGAIAHHGVWLGDSPRAAAQVLDDLDRTGVIEAIAGHFGERPVISLEKSTLRRVQPVARYAAWHQDGSFLGDGARAFNVWVALTPCGGDRKVPGLQVVTGRVPQLLPLDGERRASIKGMEVHLHAKWNGLALAVPTFEPGDAMLFDELMTHRTHLDDDVAEERLALECWFFAPSNPADRYGLLLV